LSDYIIIAIKQVPCSSPAILPDSWHLKKCKAMEVDVHVVAEIGIQLICRFFPKTPAAHLLRCRKGR